MILHFLQIGLCAMKILLKKIDCATLFGIFKLLWTLRRVFSFFAFVSALLPSRLAPRVLASATEAVRLRTASAPNKAFNEAFPTTTEGKEAARGCCYCVTFPFQNFLISCQLLICSLENWAAVAAAFDSELAKLAKGIYW